MFLRKCCIVKGKRHSADTMLDRSNENLEILTETEVEKILFDGDRGVPRQAEVKFDNDDDGIPTARCVKFVKGGVSCVRKIGRIFLAAGAFHTPELLMKS